MSAYEVNQRTIDAIVSYAKGMRGRYVNAIRHLEPNHPKLIETRQDRQGVLDAGAFSAQEWGEILLEENRKSVRYRYGDRHHDMVGDERYCHTPISVSPRTVIGCCRCLAYQSCEHPGWEGSLAKAFLDSVEDAATESALGEMPWGISDDHKED